MAPSSRPTEMAKDPEKIRLPELPVFKKYSLALRQEFASVDEILAVLDRTSMKIRDTVERADEERRRQESSHVTDPEEVDGSSVEDDPDLQVDFPDEFEDLHQDRPFWEEPGAEDAGFASLTSEDKAAPRAPKRRPKPKKKTKPAIVPVGDHGKPIGASKRSSKKKTSTKKPSTKKSSKTAPRKAVAKRAAAKRSTATSLKKKTKGSAGAKKRPRARPGSRKK